VNPGGGSGWDEAPLDIQIPDDARELDRDVLAYHREMRAQRRRNRLRRLAGPFSGRATVMPLLASILAVCLVAGAMLSVATFSPAERPTSSPSSAPATAHSGTALSASPSTAGTGSAGTASASPSTAGTSSAGTASASSSASRASRSVSPSPSSSRAATKPSPASSGSR
jgi:hypothetical protein